MKRKEARCKFNAARSQYHTFKPVCTFVEHVFADFVLPPHITFYRETMDENTCKRCKCFEDANDE